jgi:CheY-like chemotaxis protein
MESAAVPGKAGLSKAMDPRHGAFNLQSRRPPDSPKRILIVEDEPMIRMLLEDMLGDLGYAIAGEAARVAEALDAVRTTDFDLAILDLMLEGEPSLPVADALAACGRAFVFASGYGESGLPQAYRSRPILNKPFQSDELDKILRTVLFPVRS